jgi:hypothetical protein
MRLAGVAGSGGRAKARSTAAAFSAPVTRKTTSAAAESEGGQGDAVDVGPLNSECEPAGLGQSRSVRKEGCCVAVGTNPQQDEIQSRVLQLAVVELGRRLRVELAPNPVDCGRRALEAL